MKILILLIAVVAAALAVAVARAMFRAVKHDPVEYYRGWSGYWHPIGLQNRITREQADALAATGAAVLVATYGEDGKLLKVVKYLNGAVFFEYAYSYHPNGKLRRTTVSRHGRDTVIEYDERGRRTNGSVAF